MLFLGIDTGLQGGVAILGANGEIVLAERMPLVASPVYGKQMIDGGTLYDIVRYAIPGTAMVRAAIERVSAMPKQGITSAFNFGVSYGQAIAILAALQIGHEFVLPKTWKKAMNVTADKESSLAEASRLWPKLRLKKSDDGIAEALLIAEWLRRRG